MMRIMALLLTTALLCASCTALPAEERAFAVALCVAQEGETWRVHGRIPTYQTGGGYLTVTGEGPTLTAALASMEAAAPMHLHLSQLRLLVLEETLAQTEALGTALQTLAQRPDMRLQCAVALTQAPVKDVADALEPATGARLSKSIDVLLESRREQGGILAATLEEIIRMGERQSPVLMALKLDEGQMDLSGGYALTGELRIASRVTAEEASLLSLLMGQQGNLRLSLPQGGAQVRESSAHASLDANLELARVDISLRSASSEITETVLEQAVADACAELLGRLSAAGCDVLGLGRKAIVHADDMAQWHASDWPARLRQLGWSVAVTVQGPT